MNDLLTHAEQTARLIVESRYPDCDAALLAGSFVRGQATATSDLDLIIFRESIPASYRESFTFDEYPVEAFVHSSTTIRDFFRQDRERGRPSMQRMVAEGLVLRDHDLLKPLKEYAESELLAGPPVLSPAETDRARYFLTDLLDDFIGVTERSEGLGIAARLLEQATDFRLRTSGHWTGQGKWLIRSLETIHPVEAGRLVEAFESYFRSDEKQAVIDLLEQWLAERGGRYFDGFSLGK